MKQPTPAASLPITLEQLRNQANRFLTWSAGGMTLLSVSVAAIGHQNIAVTLLVSCLATLSAWGAVRHYGTATPARITVSTALAVQEMMLIFASSNLDPSHVQEAHMMYFVLNCYLLSYACWRSLVAYNLAVVAHHFILTFFVPDWVWTADSGASGVSHLAIHAGIATILVGPLIFVAVQLHNMIRDTHAALTTAGREQQNALANADEAEQNRLIALEERRKAEAERTTAAAKQSLVVETLATGLSQLANGNLVYRLSSAFAAEYETLRADFNAAAAQLQKAVAELGLHVSGTRANAKEIASATEDLARRTEKQAANLEESAAALEILTTMIHKTGESAKKARDVVSFAKTDAECSSQVLGETIKAMAQIEASAKEIDNIIGVIDEIAFQTNLLALNAGVEAARAGDAGRGFAVVATEVRALAQRSADAAKQIKTLISASGQQVGNGVGLVAETGKVLAKITGQVSALNDLIKEIAIATQEQTGGIQQLNSAVSEMDRATQQNAAMVEQTAAATAALLNDAERMESLAARFLVAEGKFERTEQPLPAQGQKDLTCLLGLR